MIERITVDTPPEQRAGHEARYQLAAEALRHGDVVLDAACGSGYGARVLTPGSEHYVGVDRDLSDRECVKGEFIEADLSTWWPAFEFDVFVGFETLEHLVDYRNYVDIAHTARRVIVMSVPVVPTVGINPYHVHDFKPGELAQIVENKYWRCTRTIDQPSEVAEICFFESR